jgi:hypothetical protein
MTYEEVKAAFGQFTRDEKQRFLEEVGMSLCQEMVSDSEFMARRMPRCLEMMGQMPQAMRQRMQEWMGAAARGKKS